MASSIKRRGFMLVLSSPSGAGKTTLCSWLLENRNDFVMSVSVTTRLQRKNEVDGRDYRFIDSDRFNAMVEAGDLLEHAQVFDHSYGSPKQPVTAALEKGQNVLFDIDWQGAQQIEQTTEEHVVSIFILPPSFEELRNRLRQRGLDSDAVVERRMAKAPNEMSHWSEYDYVLINENLDTCTKQLETIIEAESLRRSRQLGLTEFVRSLR